MIDYLFIYSNNIDLYEYLCLIIGESHCRQTTIPIYKEGSLCYENKS